MSDLHIKPFFLGKSYTAAKRVVSGGYGYLLTRVFPSLGLLLSLGLLAAAGAMLFFYKLADEVSDGNTRQFDESALTLFHRYASPRLTLFMRAMTFLGSTEFLVGLGACVVVAFVLTHWKRAMITFLVTMGGAALLTSTLKLLIGRERPDPFFGIPQPENYSFPSGHALTSFCFYGVIAAVIAVRVKGTGVRAAVGVVAGLLVILIGLSRIYLGIHYPSDVVAGYVAAFVWLMIVAAADRMMGARVRVKD